ncbi:MAG: LL-diaminopimelate aminotransferase [Microgenomates bacterium OLB22]|nr:MAG: LL-diaminopimelate aminotransferase [Microgenomates bacterium OLB22]
MPQDYFDKVLKEYDERKTVLVEGLRSIDGVICSEPEGAFYVIAQLPVDDAEDFAKWLLTDFQDDGETVMIAPAAGFYSTPGMGQSQVRIAYVLKKESLERCVKLLKKALEQYKDRMCIIN